MAPLYLIPDGNYPVATGAHPRAERVYLNLAPGMVSVTDVLEAIITVTPIEAAHVMSRDDGDEPSIYADFRRILPDDVALAPLERFAFYAEAKQDRLLPGDRYRRAAGLRQHPADDWRGAAAGGSSGLAWQSPRPSRSGASHRLARTPFVLIRKTRG